MNRVSKIMQEKERELGVRPVVTKAPPVKIRSQEPKGKPWWKIW